MTMTSPILRYGLTAFSTSQSTMPINNKQPRSPFIFTWWYWISNCYIPSFQAIGQVVLEKIFLGLPYNGQGGHLGHMLGPNNVNFLLPFTWRLQWNSIEIGPVVSEEKSFENQVLQLCMAPSVWPDPVIRPVSVCSGKCTAHMVSNEKQRN